MKILGDRPDIENLSQPLSGQTLFDFINKRIRQHSVSALRGVANVNLGLNAESGGVALAQLRGKSPGRPFSTKLMVQPPKPPPVRRAPIRPGNPCANSTMASASTQLPSKSWL